MSSAAEMSLKARLRNFAKAKQLKPQTVVQNFMFERLLERLAKSEYRDHFIIKGGILISSMVGIATRSTMDMDATVIGLKLTIRNVRSVVERIAAVPFDDGVTFSVVDVQRIRVKVEGYDGIRAKLRAKLFGLRVPLSVDFTAGDEVVPAPVEYKYSCQFSESRILRLRAYSLETVLAEKCETILQRNVTTTRTRDFYDVYILTKLRRVRRRIFKRALMATCEKRSTAGLLKRTDEILDMVAQSGVLLDYWRRYQREFPAASGIRFAEAVQAVRLLLSGFADKS